MSEYKLDFNVNEEEIRVWMDDEIARLGGWFRDFTITWHRNEHHHWLEIWSETKEDLGRMSHPHGNCLKIGDVLDWDGLSLPTIQAEGRQLYYKLKRDYPIKRDLGR